jgi:FtsH-binding integral membrane protein
MRHPLRTVLLALAVDVVLVVVFAAIGRASHHEPVLPGLFETAWPFLAGLALGWLICLGWRAPLAPARTGLPVWALTVAAGMVLRAVSGQGVVLAFVIVASTVLLVFLVGWRAVARLVTRRREPVDAA